jgi:enamine deaminase RidA (YjgF/YER057c/UK114 family)
MVSAQLPASAGVEQRLRDLGIELPSPPSPLGAYVEALQAGSLLILSGMLPVVQGRPRYQGRLGAELTNEAGYDAARIACLNGLSVARSSLGSLDKVVRAVKLGVYIATGGDFRDHAKIADGASELLLSVFGSDRLPPRIVLGVASLPLGMPVEVELVLETKLQAP